MRFRLSCCLLFVGAIATLFLEQSAIAQRQGEAIVGSPFGVAQVTLPISGEVGPVGETAFTIEERDGRALYPVFTHGRLASFLGDALLGSDRETPNSITVLFLFRGNEPLHLTAHTPERHEFTINPRVGRRLAQTRIVQRWWREYEAAARRDEREGDYPTTVQTYLTSMLARRMSLEPTLISRVTEKQPSELMQTFEMLLGMESGRRATMKSTIAAAGSTSEPAQFALPNEARWLPVETDWDANVQIEPIANHVPNNCFYVRFGSFKNYLWVNQLLEDYGGDISQMATARGHNQELTQRFQRQLGLKLTEMAKMLGDTVISDMAFIGRDTMMQEGAAVGVLFEAKNNAVLTANFKSERAVAYRKAKEIGGQMKQVRIGDVDATFMSSPDNRVRSYYVIVGNYHLFTTSRSIAESFVAATPESGSLGSLAEFKHARTTMPIDRDDTVFAYFSTEFFRGLVSPHYQVELGRRMGAITDMELVSLAELAAKAERQPANTIDELMIAGLLPRDFQKRTDNSRVVRADTELLDSARGARGYFTPIPDVEVKMVSASEQRACQQKTKYYTDDWKRLDPIMFGVKRFAMNKDGLERVAIDANVAPLDESKYGKVLSILGPNTPQRVSVPKDAIISVQATVKGGLLFPEVPPHLMFLGIMDHTPTTDLKPDGLLKTLQIIQSTPGYLGAWPKPGFLDLLPLDLDGVPDAAGFSQLPLGVWRRQTPNGFSALSFDPKLLGRVTDQLQIDEGDDYAQIRVHVGDLSTSKLQPLINSLYYHRARDVSVGNAKLWHTLSQQFRVPLPETRAIAERLVDTRFDCALGGEYELIEDATGKMKWRSTAWTKPQAEYQAPLLEWFRGLDAGLMKDDDRLVLHSSIDMQRKAAEKTIELPLFGLFGGTKKKEPDKPKKVELLPAPKSDAKRGREF